MTDDFLGVEHKENVTIVCFDRPPANAIDIPFVEALNDCLDDIATRKETGALILTGTGKCFSAGLDLKLLPTYGRDEQRNLVENLNRMLLELYSFPVPTIAAINGHAIAGGMLMVLCCDYRIASEEKCTCGLAEVRVGVPYPACAVAVIESELGPAEARTMALLGRSMSSRRAVQRGVIDEIVPSADVMPRALDLAKELAEMPRQAFGRIKRQLRARALTRMEDAVSNHNDPALDSWITAEAATAAKRILADRRRN